MIPPSTPLVFLSSQIAVSPLLTPKRLRIAKTLGISSVISVMPGSQSEADGVDVKDLADNIRDCGMEYRNIPGNGTDEIGSAAVSHFLDVIAQLPKSVLVFCQTGERAATLWASAMSGALSTNDIISAAARAGYDVTHLFDKHSIPSQRAA